MKTHQAHGKTPGDEDTHGAGRQSVATPTLPHPSRGCLQEDGLILGNRQGQEAGRGAGMAGELARALHPGRVPKPKGRLGSCAASRDGLRVAL